MGKWADQQGRVLGHVKGLYGKSKKERDWVMYGKVVDRLGYAKALLRGRFSMGVFQASWVDHKGRTLGSLEGLSSRDSLQAGAMAGHWDQWSRAGFALASNP